MGKIIGVLGGMGPEATADLFIRIIKATPAKKDQEHLRIIIDNNPKIPDRTEAILGRGPSPLPEMIRTAKNLEKAGVNFIVIPCNTAHYYYEELKKNVSIPILNMVELTAQTIKERFPHVRKVGLIGTTGTIKARIYDQFLEKLGIEVLSPTEKVQKKVMEAIYDKIKAGSLLEGEKILLNVVEHLIMDGAQLIICGCTEVSLALKDAELSVPIVDPLQILAKKAVEKALEGN